MPFSTWNLCKLGEYLAFLRYLRSLHPPSVRIAIVLDDFSPHLPTETDPREGDRAHPNNVELAYVPFYASWLNRHTHDQRLSEIVDRAKAA
jgi:hypothetical protein